MKRELLGLRLGRRDFLKVSSAAVASPGLLAVDSKVRARAATAVSIDDVDPAGVGATGSALAQIPRTISGWNGRFAGSVTIGYYDGSPLGHFVDARSLEAGDDLLAFDGASIEVIDGELVGQPDLDDVRSLSLSFDLHPVQEGALRVWYRQLAPVPHSSATTSVWLPLDPEHGLIGWLDVRTQGQQESMDRIPIVFGSAGAGANANGLRSGYYAIAIKSGRTVDWERVQLHGSCGGNALCLTADGSPLANVPWLLLSVALTRA